MSGYLREFSVIFDVHGRYKYPTNLLTSAIKHEALLSYAKIKRRKSGQSLYIPAMYNPMVDPNEEIMDMIEQFQDVVKQLDELERQLKCAANCTANQSSAFTGNGSFELDYEVTFSNGSASFGSHNSSEEVDTCLRNCSMEPIVFRTAEEAEVLISSKMAQLRILEGSLRGKLASRRTWLATRTRHRRQQKKGGAANRAGKTRGQDVARARVLDKWLREDRSKQ